MLGSQNIVSQILRFFIVSGIAFAIDAGVYFLLSSHFEVDGSWAKRISFACVSIWGYFAHKHFTFRHRVFRASEPIRFAIVYFTGWILNSIIYDLTIYLDQTAKPAFLAATFVWACWNFIGQKWFVFAEPDSDKG